jgi:hypothetical protein
MRLRKLGDAYYKRFLEWAGVKAANEMLDVNYKKIITNIVTAEKEAAKRKETKNV